MEKIVDVLAFTSFYLPGYKGGGPIKTIQNLTNQTSSELKFKLITRDRDLGDTVPYSSVTSGVWYQIGNASVFFVCSGKAAYVQIVRQFLAINYDVVYVNSFFSPCFSFFPLILAKVLRKSVVVAPRGEFSEGALSFKSGKKRVFIRVFKLLGLHRGTVFQVSSDFEAEDIRRALGKNLDIQVAENIGAQEFTDRLPLRAEKPLKAVFISRISPKKNLLAALKILQQVQQPLIYDIYGPIEDRDYWAECEKALADLSPHIQVQHRGLLNPDDVVKVLANYDVFFFPTKGENYGHVIAEALCAGLPLLIANTTPWRNLEEQGIGWDIPLNNPETFSAVLDELASMPADEHQKMRERVLAWAKNKFSQRDAVEANIALFKYAYEKK